MNDTIKAVDVLARLRTEDYGGTWRRADMNDPDVCYEVKARGHSGATLGGVLESLCAIGVPYFFYADKCSSRSANSVSVRVYMDADDVPHGARVELDNGNHYIDDGTRHYCRCSNSLDWDHNACPSCVTELVAQREER